MIRFTKMTSTRRNFLRAIPAAVTSLALTDTSFSASNISGQEAMPVDASMFQSIAAEIIEDDIKALQTKPGTNYIVNGKNLTVALIVENAKMAAEFEWHDRRDHLVQVIEGTTEIEVGGIPKGGRSIAPGEWRASTAEGTTKIILRKGDMLAIPRGTLHRRHTAETATFTQTTTRETAWPGYHK